MFRQSTLCAVVLCVIVGTAQTSHAASVEVKGQVWRVTLTHQEVQTLSSLETVATLLANPEPAISKAVFLAVTAIVVIDEIGGKKGVEVTGVMGMTLVTVTPKGKGPFGLLVKSQENIKKLGDHWVRAVQGNIAEVSKKLASVDPGPAMGKAVAKIDPGPAIAAAFGQRKKSRPATPQAPATPEPGVMHAKSNNLDAYEKFVLVALEDGKVALLFHTGYLTAIDEGGKSCFANRDVPGPWERWDLLRNADGTVTLRSKNGHFLYAQDGGGKGLDVTSRNHGVYERFHLEFDDQGRAGLRVKDKKMYVIADP